MADARVIARRALLGAAGGMAFGPGVAAAPREARGRSPAPRPLVMLDPGHGGKDPGAVGAGGTFEKHVALATALELRRQVEASGRCRVELTRTRDVFVPLEERVRQAQRRGAALFLSLHADALPDRGVRGASVYTLSNAASDAQTEALARRENSADRFAPGAAGLPPAVASILASLVRRETRAGSARAARALVGQLAGQVPMLSNPARHAGFAVLRAADVPSVLIEVGFISNPRDETLLRRTDHRARVATAIRRALETALAASDHGMAG